MIMCHFHVILFEDNDTKTKHEETPLLFGERGGREEEEEEEEEKKREENTACVGKKSIS
jgi:hypothetical protein